MGLLGQVQTGSANGKVLPKIDFTAEMIAPGCDAGTGGAGSFVAREFDLATVQAGSLLHLSAQGLYRAFLNGHRVGSDLLTPGWTNYDKRLGYQTYPVADLLVPGENRLEIWLGDGWLRLPDDYVLKAMLEQLGATVTLIEAPYQPEQGAYGGGHHHSHAGDAEFSYAPRLHQFGARK